MEFAAAAWSDPLIVRIFYINKDLSASEWTFRGGSWADTSDTMAAVKGLEEGQPVAASRSMNGTGRYLGFYYAAPEGQINSVGSNADGNPSFQTLVAEYEVPPKPEELKTVDKWTIIGSVFGVLAVVVTVLIFFRGYIKRFYRWCKNTVTEEASSK
jgi:hypothetical protein